MMERNSYFRKTLNRTEHCRKNNTEALVISKRLISCPRMTELACVGDREEWKKGRTIEESW